MTTITKIDDTIEFLALRHEWQELLQDSPSDCLFLSWEWLYTWWLHLGEDRKLSILTVRKAGRLIAIAPLVQRPSQLSRFYPFRALEFLGSGDVGSDYMSFIVRNDCEREALDAISTYLLDSKLVLDLNRIDQDAVFMQQLVLRLRNNGFRSARTSTDICPYIKLEGFSWESYVASLGRSHRTNVKRRLKKLHADFNVTFERARTEEQRNRALDMLIKLHLERWGERGGSTALHNTALREFHQAISRLALQQDSLRLYLLSLNGRPALAVYCFKYRNRFLYYQAGFDTEYSSYSIGLVGVALSIKEAIKEGASEFDFLHGSENYKDLWAKERNELVQLDLYPPNPLGNICRQAMRTRDSVKNLLLRRKSLLQDPL